MALAPIERIDPQGLEFKEKVSVNDRCIRWPSKLPKKNDRLRKSGPPSAPPNWFWLNGGGPCPAG